MKSDSSILVEGLSKKLCKSLRRGILYGLSDFSTTLLGFGAAPRNQLRTAEFWALKDIGFEVPQGHTLGLIGQNGSGKTTLLRMLNGIFPPDEGRIEVRGRMAPLIAVGAGFHPHMSGRENVYLNGAILGMSKAELDREFDRIVDFAEIEAFIDAPVSSYSSGMRIRLGFAIAVHSPLSIILIDEVLAVGDESFKQKCFEKVGELRKQGVTTILVSHNMNQITVYCDSVLLLDKGKQIFTGPTLEGLSLYREYYSDHNLTVRNLRKRVTGASGFQVDKVEFSPPMKDDLIEMGDKTRLQVDLHYTADRAFDDIDYYCEVYVPDQTHKPFFRSTSRSQNKKLCLKEGKGVLSLSLEPLSLANTKGYMDIVIYKDNRAPLLNWAGITLDFPKVLENQGWSGMTARFETKSESRI